MFTVVYLGFVASWQPLNRALYERGINVTIKDEFASEIREAINQCYELGYRPSRFEEMIATSHPVDVAKAFVVSGDFQSGFKQLKKLGKLNLTVEGIMINPKYSTLFTKAELEAAKWRLENV
ncbi:hypothetical protein P3445_22490 [Vibrio parahaemolyticus]|nr:hypothetical protein [Vibrio parahaemolyticus]